MSSESLARRLGLKDATALVVGSIIGTGVFLKTAVMAQDTGSPALVLAAWLVAGILSLLGALSYAELGTLYPKAGGEYVYLREAWGPLTGFLYGWTRFWIVTPGSIAAYAVGAATFLNGSLSLGPNQIAVAMFMIVIFTVLNCFSVAFGGGVQTFLTVFKIIMIAGLAVAIFTVAPFTRENFSTPADLGWRGWSGFGSAILAALWAFDGWNNLPMAAGEVRDPRRCLPRALAGGMIAVLLVYGLVNLAYFYALPFAEILKSNSTAFPDALPVATRAAVAVIGPKALGILSIAFVISALGAMNGSILTGARVPYAMAHDGLFMRWLGKVNSKSLVPVNSVLAQGVLACLLAKSGTFDQLTDYVVIASWIFYALNM
ncbi:MAG: APC family permease, partial [Bdellovibrionales bacterium]